MRDREYIKELELRIVHAAEAQRAMQSALGAVLSEREDERKKFENRANVERDMFASSAMNGILAACPNQSIEPWRVAERAYEIADAMLKERELQAEK